MRTANISAKSLANLSAALELYGYEKEDLFIFLHCLGIDIDHSEEKAVKFISDYIKTKNN